MNKDREIIIVKKKKGHGHGHHGGAWKVAFADFMTAMFALFLVLWLVNQSSDVKAAIAGYFQNPLGNADEFGSSIIPGEGAQTQAPRPLPKPQVADLRRDRLQMLGQEIRQQLAATPEFKDMAQHLVVEVVKEGLRLQLLEDSAGIFFETGSAVPKPRTQDFLRALGARLATLPNGVVVDGYTDAKPYAAANGYTNWELSADRANSARRLLVEGGLNDAQLQGVRGHADRDLRSPSEPFAASNRRVTITMLLRRPGDPADTTLRRDTLAAAVPPMQVTP